MFSYVLLCPHFSFSALILQIKSAEFKKGEFTLADVKLKIFID